MRIVVQRVQRACVSVEEKAVGQIGRGLLVLFGVGHQDSESDAEWMAAKTAQLRIFPDSDGKMNCSVEEIGGAILVVSQFTLLGDCRKGRRPAFTDAAEPATAKRIYEYYCQQLAERGLPVATGIFAADMQVELVNDGPVTLIIDR